MKEPKSEAANQDGSPALASAHGSAASEVQVVSDAWAEALALRLAYEIHRNIGNNIHQHRKETQREILAAIRNAVKRNSEPPNDPSSATASHE